LPASASLAKAALRSSFSTSATGTLELLLATRVAIPTARPQVNVKASRRLAKAGEPLELPTFGKRVDVLLGLGGVDPVFGL